jgi:NAD(P)-dependent dehydrogenase (short-subunit alcohol dehydrogenase family)
VSRWLGALRSASPRSLNGGAIGPHYAASKAALRGLMRNLVTPLAGAGWP